MTESLRLFFAVDLEPKLKREIAHECEDLRKKFDRSTLAPGHDNLGPVGTGPGHPEVRRKLSWVSEENHHFTMKFLGSTPKDRVSSVLESAQAAMQGITPFEIEARNLRCFSRVLWMDVSDPSQSLSRIAKALESRLASLGFEEEMRPYVAHLTLARLKEGRPFHPQDIEELAGERINATFGHCRVSELILFKSETLKTGAKYEVLGRIPLKAGVELQSSSAR